MIRWKEIIINELIYEVSDFGDVVSKTSGKTLKQRLNADGYCVVTMGSFRCGRVSRSVHRLVAELFVSKPEGHEVYEVNHIDYDRTNNAYTNLEWMTHEDNVKYSVCNKPDQSGTNNPNYKGTKLKEYYMENPSEKIKLGRPGRQNGRCVPTAICDKDKNTIMEFSYIGECADYLKSEGITGASINAIRDRIRLSIKNDRPYKGLYFKFIK